MDNCPKQLRYFRFFLLPIPPQQNVSRMYGISPTSGTCQRKLNAISKLARRKDMSTRKWKRHKVLSQLTAVYSKKNHYKNHTHNQSICTQTGYTKLSKSFDGINRKNWITHPLLEVSNCNLMRVQQYKQKAITNLHVVINPFSFFRDVQTLN